MLTNPKIGDKVRLVAREDFGLLHYGYKTGDTFTIKGFGSTREFITVENDSRAQWAIWGFEPVAADEAKQVSKVEKPRPFKKGDLVRCTQGTDNRVYLTEDNWYRVALDQINEWLMLTEDNRGPKGGHQTWSASRFELVSSAPVKDPPTAFVTVSYGVNENQGTRHYIHTRPNAEGLIDVVKVLRDLADDIEQTRNNYGFLKPTKKEQQMPTVTRMFNKGDEVECIESQPAFLTFGRTYIIGEDQNLDRLNIKVMRDDSGTGSYWQATRFKLLAAGRVDPKPNPKRTTITVEIKDYEADEAGIRYAIPYDLPENGKVDVVAVLKEIARFAATSDVQLGYININPIKKES